MRCVERDGLLSGETGWGEWGVGWGRMGLAGERNAGGSWIVVLRHLPADALCLDSIDENHGRAVGTVGWGRDFWVSGTFGFVSAAGNKLISRGGKLAGRIYEYDSCLVRTFRVAASTLTSRGQQSKLMYHVDQARFSRVGSQHPTVKSRCPSYARSKRRARTSASPSSRSLPSQRCIPPCHVRIARTAW